MPPLPMRPLVDNCTTTADGLSRGNFPVPSGGVLSLCAWGFFRAWACFALYARAAVPGGPFPAAADVTPRPLPRMGKGGGMG
jgi:hypothetical protein